MIRTVPYHECLKDYDWWYEQLFDKEINHVNCMNNIRPYYGYEDYASNQQLKKNLGFNTRPPLPLWNPLF